MSDENSPIGPRIKSERLRLGLPQPDFAEKAHASKRALIEWEKGNTHPDANQLAALEAIGVDVLYVITGRRMSESLYRSGESAEMRLSEPRPSDRESRLVESFRDLDEAGRKAIEQMAAALKAAKGK